MAVLKKLRIPWSTEEIVPFKQYLYLRKENVDCFKFSWAARQNSHCVKPIRIKSEFFLRNRTKSGIEFHHKYNSSPANSQHPEEYQKKSINGMYFALSLSVERNFIVSNRYNDFITGEHLYAQGEWI